MNTFESMLDDVYAQLGEKQKTKLQIPHPILEIVSTNTQWKNVKDFLKKIKRNPDQFIEYLKLEFDNVNWKTSSKSDGIIIIGKIKKDKIMKVMQQYMNKYVICSSCKSNNSKLLYDNNIKKYKFICKGCLCEYYI
jgi:translation initiation factor 2 beta subunit (eIF-2beta)/eIF-5